jgi:hypothetical protein
MPLHIAIQSKQVTMWQYWNPYKFHHPTWSMKKNSINLKIWIDSSHTQIATILNTYNARAKVELKLEPWSLNTIIYFQNLIAMLNLNSFPW